MRRASKDLIEKIAACLRIIRPTRQRGDWIQLDVQSAGTLDIHSMGDPTAVMELPECQKLFRLRLRDLDQFRSITPTFLKAYERKCWRFMMAMQFYEAGHFAHDQMWKVRFFLWVAAVEALFTSSLPEHKGSNVARARLNFFLGGSTPVFEQGDIPSYLQQPSLKVSDSVKDIYDLRNRIAHGAKVEDIWFRVARQGVNEQICYAEELIEALSFIARRSLYKILSEDLLDTFANETEWEKYFTDHELTRSAIERKRKATIPAADT
jgi:hypothetical protein